jgi:hypothetical protein
MEAMQKRERGLDILKKLLYDGMDEMIANKHLRRPSLRAGSID